MNAKILGGANNFFTVEREDGKIFSCSIKGKVLRLPSNVYNPLAPGDEVELQKEGDDSAIIKALIPRRNAITRLNIKTYSPQTLAANIDLMLCLTTPQSPPFRPRFVDRLIVEGERAKVPIIIVLNKLDLGITNDVNIRLSNWEVMGYDVLRISTKENCGLDILKDKLKGKTSLLIGQSGVGKSSLLNALAPSLKLKTSELSYKYNRGVHTTTHSYLFNLEDDIKIIDTPGIRNFSLWDVDDKELIEYFRELKDLSLKCKFSPSCKHEGEMGCAILEALDKEAILYDRYENYIRIKEEIRALRKFIR